MTESVALPPEKRDRPNLSEVPAPDDSPRRARVPSTPVLILALASLYFVLARLGLSVATVGQSVTLVWPSAGVALVALLLFGNRLWPGVAVGALLVNALTPGVPFLSACGMAAGNTLAAVLATSLLRRAGFRLSLERVRDVVLFLILAAGLSPTVSATLGSLSLYSGGVISEAQLGMAWRMWWLGDLMGDLIVAPVLLTVVERAGRRKPPYHSKEALGLVASLLAISLISFGAVHFLTSRLIHPYFVFPVLIWAALRFLVLGAAGANLIVACTSVWATVSGKGPFSEGTLGENLLQLQTFMAVVAPTTLILGAAAAERLRAIRLRDQFLSMAAHELKTPLTPLKLQIHLFWRALASASETTDGKMAEQLGKKISVFDKQLDRLVRLVDELLDVSRVQSGQLTLALAEFELGSVVREAVEAFSEELALAKCNVEVRTEDRIPGIWDRLRIQQVVWNLLTNAMKYGRGRPIIVTVDWSSPHGSARIAISDSGAGIPSTEQERIFEAFERGSHVPGVGGLGLGLYIVSKIVQAHHGSVSVRSKLGVGSTFTVQLPVNPPRAKAI
jgi:signal transduction histidine kinase